MNCCLRKFQPGLLPLLLTRLPLAACLLSGCALPLGARKQATPTPVTVTIAGSTEMRPLLVELTTAYRKRNPHVQFTLRGGGSRLGEQWLAADRIDIAASAAIDLDAELPADLVRIPIGLDRIALIVHADNPVEALTLAQIRDLYAGRALRWEDVGGDGDALLVSREAGSATRAFFEKRVMGEERTALTAVVLSTSSLVVKYVASHRAAIGYVTSAYLAQNAESAVEESAMDRRPATGIRMVKAVSVDSHYPLTRRLFLLIRRNGTPTIQDVIDFALSEEGQRIVARYHTPNR